MSDDITATIPGTTYRVKFGVEGKYYALSLYRGSVEHKTKPLTILRGSALQELPEEVENCLRDLLDSEEVYLSPVIVKRVVNNLIDQIPEDGKVKTVDETQKEFVKRELKVTDLINKSNKRAEKKSIAEYTPSEKSKIDATADDIGKIPLRKAKPLPEKIIKKDETVSEKPTPAVKPIKAKPKPKVEIKQKETEVEMLDEKVKTLSTEVETLQGKIEKSNQEIEELKEKVNQIKKDVQEPLIEQEEEMKPIEEPNIEPVIEEKTESENIEESTIEPSIDDSES